MGKQQDKDCLNEYRQVFKMKEEDDDENHCMTPFSRYGNGSENDIKSPMIGLKIRKESNRDL